MSAAELSPAAVTARLLRASEMSRLARRGLPPKVGGDPAAVTARLRRVSRLRELCLRLSRLGGPGAGDDPPSGARRAR
ncbi:MAG: hypothetical protein KatS3mg102_0025 [Planctomycetota bacterium]|nr:MAG: hypothetical protein KatS3mg102_0025 [Planctomycetota bacterium]